MTQYSYRKCSRCNWPVSTQSEVRRSYARLCDAGLSVEEVKRLSPLCERCATVVIKEEYENWDFGVENNGD